MKSMKLGSSAGRPKTTPTSTPDHTQPGNLTPEVERPRRKMGAASAQKSVIPRTRDDSSDEEDRSADRPGHLLDNAPSLMGHAPMLPHHFPGNYPPPHPHMMPFRGGPEHFYPHAGPGLVGVAPLPPHSVGTPGCGILPPHMAPPPHMVSS